MKLCFVILLCVCTVSTLAQKTVDETEGNVNALSSSFFNVVGYDLYNGNFNQVKRFK
jgi:hypothetical protein